MGEIFVAVRIMELIFFTDFTKIKFISKKLIFVLDNYYILGYYDYVIQPYLQKNKRYGREECFRFLAPPFFVASCNDAYGCEMNFIASQYAPGAAKSRLFSAVEVFVDCLFP